MSLKPLNITTVFVKWDSICDDVQLANSITIDGIPVNLNINIVQGYKLSYTTKDPEKAYDETDWISVQLGQGQFQYIFHDLQSYTIYHFKLEHIMDHQYYLATPISSVKTNTKGIQMLTYVILKNRDNILHRTLICLFSSFSSSEFESG